MRVQTFHHPVQGILDHLFGRHGPRLGLFLLHARDCLVDELRIINVIDIIRPNTAIGKIEIVEPFAVRRIVDICIVDTCEPIEFEPGFLRKLACFLVHRHDNAANGGLVRYTGCDPGNNKHTQDTGQQQLLQTCRTSPCRFYPGYA